MSNKTKNILLIVGFILTCFITYRLTISKTIDLKKEFNNLQQQELSFQKIPEQLSILRQKEKHYDSLLTRYKINGSSIQNSLLKTINTTANSYNIKVVNFLEPHILETDNLNHKTYQFSLEGEYNSIIKLVYKLEQDTKFGEIINLHFEKKKNFRTSKYYLQAKVLLHSFS